MKNPQWLLVTIEDSGPGVPPGLRQRIFEPFFTTKSPEAGTGLGLSIAHTIMADHHGQIHYIPSSLGGAGFQLEFPVVTVAAAAPTAEPASLRPPPGRPAPARVLVLDDEQFIAELLAEMLSVLGHKPVVCLSAAAALKQVDESEFDLIISDFRMPVMNGEEFYHQLAARKPELAGRVIFLTGDVVNEETQHFLASTGNPHLDKPFQLARLEAVIAGVLCAKSELAPV
jgi:CheY-like chemotaxis protein